MCVSTEDKHHKRIRLRAASRSCGGRREPMKPLDVSARDLVAMEPYASPGGTGLVRI
jgi:hypothetical protein